MAIASASEAEYQLLLARDLGYLDTDVHEDLSQTAVGVRQMLIRLAQRLAHSAPRTAHYSTNLSVPGRSIFLIRRTVRTGARVTTTTPMMTTAASVPVPMMAGSAKSGSVLARRI